ncbi:MAG: sigma-70 family RNA polymerase sigma factor, partial [Eubacteriales bacterium]|nr:sigma-70 family RNA polymerase sigma factor [Eubacteriales bacterium]
MEKRENKDGKLVRLAQSGDNDAMEQLCAEYKDTVRMLARPYFLIGADRDDLIQEGMIGLYKAIRDYREDHNASFASFAELCITRQILSAINASRRQKHQPLNSYISLYRTPESGDRELLELIEQPGGDPEERFISRETAAA